MSLLSQQLERYQFHTDRALRAHLSTLTTAPSLTEAMTYSLFAGGKRVRPALTLATCEALGQSLELALPVACALEMIHTYSLIHDDLPAMDDDTLRRGMPTSHIRFGEATAILAGDGLLTQAFAIVSDSKWSIDPQLKVSITALIAKAAGTEGMVGGQLLDLIYEGKPCTEAELKNIHVHKTGALLKASVIGGALAANADASMIERLGIFGDSIGLAFQIADDVLDVTASSKELGKDAGSDLKKQKSTYVSILGIEKSRTKAKELLNLALDQVAPLGEKAKTLQQLATYIVERKN